MLNNNFKLINVYSSHEMKTLIVSGNWVTVNYIFYDIKKLASSDVETRIMKSEYKFLE